MEKMANNLIKISALLSDGNYHTETSMATILSTTSLIVSKLIKKLESYNVLISFIKEKGYRLEEPLILLDKIKIKKLLSTKAINIKIFEKIDSTNDALKQALLKNRNPTVYLAETQTNGKGRLDRSWYSPFGKNIYLSLAYFMHSNNFNLSGLSIIVGLAMCAAVEENCQVPNGLKVKWPNDIIANQQKLAGILIETTKNANDYTKIIIGIGINVNMLQADKDAINQPWTSLQKLTGNYIDRNQLCALLINKILVYLQRFKTQGLQGFMEEWKKRDILFNQPVRLNSNNLIFCGIGIGINNQGHLLLQFKDNLKQSFSSGESNLIK